MKKLRIAHISDLHCDASSEWDDIGAYILKCLKDIVPDILVVSGDIVDFPNKNNFKKIDVFFDKIKDELGEDNFCSVIVPGNHDVYPWGNRFFNMPFIDVASYKGFERKFMEEYGGYDEMLRRIFLRHKIAFFPLDSNSGRLIYGFAQGNVKSPQAIIKNYEDKYKSWSCSEGLNYDNLIKIIVLHHNPLSLAIKKNKELIEPFLLLNNAYQLLEVCKDFHIDLIMHGHRHVSGLIGFKFYYDDNGDNLMTISSCSTTGKYVSDIREIKLLEVGESGSMHFHRYISEAHNNAFLKQTEKIETRYYGDIRKKKKESVSRKCLGAVKNIRNKTKIITIKNGTPSFVSITLSSINWCEDISYQEKFIKERFRSDLGRIPGGLYDFSQCGTSAGLENDWYNPFIDNGLMSKPENPEAFERKFSPKDPISHDENDCFRMNYFLYAGFALTSRDHAEKYKGWPLDRDRQESASISTEYPVESLELIVKFPDNKDFFPPINSFKVEAYKKEDMSSGKMGLEMLYGDLHCEEEETRFLRDKGALRVRPEINEANIVIKYPRVDLEYAMRWDLPKVDKRAIDNYERYGDKNEALIKRILSDDNKSRVQEFYSVLESGIKDSVFRGYDYSVFFLAYDYEDKLLKVIGTPQKYIDQVKGNIIVGRGPAGKSFLDREVVYWEPRVSASERYGYPSYPIEAVIDGLHPVKVFAMPLTYPDFISEDGSVGDDSTTGYIYPAWGCISVVACDDDGFKCFNSLRQEDRGETLLEKYLFINKIIKENFFLLL